MRAQNPKKAKVQNEPHRSGPDDKTLCSLEVAEGILVDVPRHGDFVHSEITVTCQDCQRAKRLAKAQATVTQLNELTPRKESFRLISVEINRHTTFSSAVVIRKAIIKALF